MRLNKGYYKLKVIECFHSRGQHICKFIGTKESVCIRKEFKSQRTGLGHQHGRRFVVLGHQYGRRDVMWKHSICLLDSLLFPRSRGRTCPSSLAQTTQQTDYKGPACIVTRKKSDYVLITITGRNVLNTKNFDLPEVRTATRSSWQALFQGTLSPLLREARHVFTCLMFLA